MDDAMIITLFIERSEDSIAALDVKYGAALRALSQRILSDPSDAEECVNDAYLGIWNRIPPEHPENLLAYASRVVRNLSINRYRKNTAQKRCTIYDVTLSELEGCISCPDTVESKMEQAEMVKLIEDFLASLNTENRVLFLRRYWYTDSYEDIASRLGLSEKVVSVRLVRLRKQLRKYLTARGVAI